MALGLWLSGARGCAVSCGADLHAGITAVAGHKKRPESGGGKCSACGYVPERPCVACCRCDRDVVVLLLRCLRRRHLRASNVADSLSLARGSNRQTGNAWQLRSRHQLHRRRSTLGLERTTLGIRRHNLRRPVCVFNFLAECHRCAWFKFSIRCDRLERTGCPGLHGYTIWLRSLGNLGSMAKRAVSYTGENYRAEFCLLHQQGDRGGYRTAGRSDGKSEIWPWVGVRSRFWNPRSACRFSALVGSPRDAWRSTSPLSRFAPALCSCTDVNQ